MKSYGIGYMGSKSRIAEKIVSLLPSAEHFYDLFAGGCAISHRAMEEGRWKHFHINDINPFGPRLFVDALNGKYRDERRWVSREDFHRLKREDPYVAIIWSFGNNQKNYLYGPDIEPYKKALHYAVLLDDISLAREYGYDLSPVLKEAEIGARMRVLREIVGKDCKMQNIAQTTRLMEVERTARLAGLRATGITYEATGITYEATGIEPDSVVYADIPYKGVGTYLHKFDHERFYEWASSQRVPVFISEYDMPRDRFRCVWECELNQTMGSYKEHNPAKRTERLFVPINQREGIISPSLL